MYYRFGLVTKAFLGTRFMPIIAGYFSSAEFLTTYRNHQSRGTAFEDELWSNHGFLVGLDLSPYQYNSPVPFRRGPGAHHAKGEGVVVDGAAKDHMVRMSDQA